MSFSVETAHGYARLGRDLVNRLAGQVELDRVVDVRRVEWSGHVYSLTSVEGWHTANSLIVSNCDCFPQPSQESGSQEFVTDPMEMYRRGQITDLSRAQRERIDSGQNLNKVLNESRDRWRERLAAERVSDDPASVTTIHDFMASLTSQVNAKRALRAAGIAA